MKNILNEEIDQIKYLLNYNRGLTLSEQKNNPLINENTAPSGLGGNWDPSTGEYTIVKGDTLSKIGNAFGVKWMDIWEENKDTLRSGQPNCGRYCGYNWIFIGEVITIPGKTEAPSTTNTDTTVTNTTATDTTATNTTATNTTATDTTATDTNVVPVVTSSGSEEEKTGREKRQEKRSERQANRDARQLERQKRREERRKEISQNASTPATLPNSQTADLGNVPKEVTQYFEQLQTTDPYDILANSKSNDREVAFKKAREIAQKQLGINYEPKLVGTRKITSNPDGYNVYAAFKK
jgi:LysM repeat protein